MPEIPLAHSYEDQGVESVESELTPGDRERLHSLFLEAERYGLSTYYDRSREAVELRMRIRDEDGKAARYILECLSGITARSEEFFRYVGWLDLCASEQHTEEISVLLAQEDVMFDTNRSIRGNLLKILQRIGTSTSVEHIAYAASRCFDVSYGTEIPAGEIGLQTGDSTEMLIALLLIKERTEDAGAKQNIENAIEAIKENIYHHTGNFFSDYELSYSIDLAHEDIDRFGRYFEVFVPEPEDDDDRARALDIQDERNMSWEDEQDGEIQDNYRENRFAETESRLEVIKRLRHEIKKEQEIKEDPEDDDARFLRRHWLEYREENPSPYAPTLGIEIEIREQSVLPSPPTGRKWAEVEKESFLTKKKQEYIKTRKLGVPAGNDKFWEFANAPTHYYTTLSREVQALIEMGLINQDYARHPLHITIGGITLGVSMSDFYGRYNENIEEVADKIMPESGKETFVLARSLEATGWSTTGGRLLRPYLAKGNRSAWAVKGVGGVKERSPDQIELGVTEAVEFRTFQLQNFTGLDRTLRSAFLLGAALRACQANARKAPFEIAEDPAIREQLSEVWKKFSDESRKIFSEYNIPDPHNAWQTPSYTHNDDTRAENPFKYFGDILDDARQHPQSRGADFVAEMRGLIIKTRKQIADIIYQKVPSDAEES